MQDLDEARHVRAFEVVRQVDVHVEGGDGVLLAGGAVLDPHGWRMSLMPTRLMGMRRVSARPCTSSTWPERAAVDLALAGGGVMDKAYRIGAHCTYICRGMCLDPGGRLLFNLQALPTERMRSCGCRDHQRSTVAARLCGVQAGRGQAGVAGAVLDEPVGDADLQQRQGAAPRRRAARRMALPAPPATAFSSSVTKARWRAGQLQQRAPHPAASRSACSPAWRRAARRCASPAPTWGRRPAARARCGPRAAPARGRPAGR